MISNLKKSKFPALYFLVIYWLFPLDNMFYNL